MGQHCGGADGTWMADGTYTGGLGAQGTQKWTIPVDATGKAGTFTYTDVQTMTVGGIDVDAPLASYDQVWDVDPTCD